MPKSKVLLQQYVEQVAEIEVEADDSRTAETIALRDACKAEWKEGDDAYAVQAYAVEDENGEVVWQR